MKIIARLGRGADTYALVRLSKRTFNEQVNGIIVKGENKKAIDMILSSGKNLKEMDDHQKTHEKATLIITEKSVHWDLMG